MLRLGLVALTIVMVIACGVLLATSVRTVLRPSTVPAVELSQPALPPAEERSFEQYQAIASQNLFHAAPTHRAAPPTSEEKLEESKLQVRLIGTAAASDPAFSVAAVEDLRSRERLVVRSQDELAGARVVRIERERIVLKNDGRLEAITLDEEKSSNAPSRRTASRRSALHEERPEAPTPSLEDRVRRLGRTAGNAFGPEAPQGQSVLTQARIVPRYGEGAGLDGLELSAIKPESLLEAAGLRNGDLVVGVNGNRISDPAQGLKSFRSLNDKQGFVVDVDRNGQILELEYAPEE